MAKLFPFRGETEVSQEPRLVNLDDETADDVFAALSSDTARAVLNRLYEEPATASDVADAVDTSLQNARYHIEKLKEAGLIEEVDTWYSSRGTEMTVYAPTNEPLVVAAGREESRGVLREALTRVIGAVALLAVASALVDRLARMLAPQTGAFATRDTGSAEPEVMAAETTEAAGGAGDGANASATTTPTPTEGGMGVMKANETAAASPTPAPEATSTPAETARTVVETRVAERTVEAASTDTPAAAMDGGLVEAVGSAVPPGVLFFAGGLLVVALAAGWWYWSRYRPLYG